MKLSTLESDRREREREHQMALKGIFVVSNFVET